MKHLLLTTLAAVVLAGCGPSVDIHQAAKDGNIEAVKQAIAASTDVNTKDRYENTPLHIAAKFGHKEIAELLITEGADVAPLDVAGAPLDMAGAPLDVAGGSSDVACASLDVAGAPLDVDVAPLDVAGG